MTETTHKPPSEMTDAEIGEFLAINLMGWHLDDFIWCDADGCCDGYVRDAKSSQLAGMGMPWNPARDLNQAIECVRYGYLNGISDHNYIDKMWKVLGFEIWGCATIASALISTPRQHCDALIEAVREMEGGK